METADEIWTGDLFDRRSEAEDLIGYLESVSTRRQIRDEGHAHVLAVDASYGQGKSFFLRRFARHMALEHAVAFVDAWVDDLEDQPLVALAATLDRALEPWRDEAPDLPGHIANFREKAGEVAKIVGVGVAKRIASFVIMQSGAEALGDVLGKADGITKDLAKDSLKDTGNSLVDNVSAGVPMSRPSSMEENIARFREGQQAIRDMKDELSRIVESLLAAGMKLPITIVIDELDRCRPTYSIKLLEELKHLFDVPGMAFVLGLHGQQLACSVTAAYGLGFDSNGYLRRFINRRYLLREVAITPLIKRLCVDLNIPVGRLMVPNIANRLNVARNMPGDVAQIIADNIRAFGLSARDAFTVMEMLQTFLGISGDGEILLPLILPMIIYHVRNDETTDPEPSLLPNWVYVLITFKAGVQQIEEYTIKRMYSEMDNAARMTSSDLSQRINNGQSSTAQSLVAGLRFGGHGDRQPNDPTQYRALLHRATRFVSE